MGFWDNQRVLITGACGTVGQELIKQLLVRNAGEIIGLDNNESEVFHVSENYRSNNNIKLFVADIRDSQNLRNKMHGISIVFHTAALKHVILCEQAPTDAVQINILGTQNVIDAASQAMVKRVLFTSSDKAVNPTNVMGTSKLMGERLMTAANAHQRGNGPIFSSTRFGNVLGSRGSVIPLFARQIANGGPVTLTDERMTRFIMTIEEAACLVIDSVEISQGGEVFVTKMPAIRISDLAHVMIKELAPIVGHDPESITLEVIGSKPGEKLYEELLNDEERRRTVEMENYFVITPAFRGVYKQIDYNYPDVTNTNVSHEYNSNNVDLMDKEQLQKYLLNKQLFDSIL